MQPKIDRLWKHARKRTTTIFGHKVAINEFYFVTKIVVT